MAPSAMRPLMSCIGGAISSWTCNHDHKNGFHELAVGHIVLQMHLAAEEVGRDIPFSTCSVMPNLNAFYAWQARM